MCYPNKPYFSLYTDISNTKPLHTPLAPPHCFLSGGISDTQLWRCAFMLGWAQVLGSCLVVNKTWKGDKQWMLNYFCLCQVTPEALGITNMLCAGIGKFTTLSKCWVYRPLESDSFSCFPVKILSQYPVLTPFPACTLLLPHSIKSFALWVY